MSLTSELKNKSSPASQFMRAQFPNTRRVMALSRGRMGSDVHTCHPVGQVPYPLIGTALDYRLRFYFPQTGCKGLINSLVCYAGAAKACGGVTTDKSFGGVRQLVPPAGTRSGYLETDLLLAFFASLEALLSRLAPAQRRLNEADEDTLQRHCIVMAALDVFSRAGYDQRSILLNPQPKVTLEELLAVGEDAWIDDLRTLSWNFYDKFSPLLSKKVCLNPTFDGSRFVGGADADLIVDNCLIDIKTTINPLKDAEWVYQILGYVLLDWHDENHIQEVAIYLSRQCFLLKWSLDDLLLELMGKPGSLPELRQQWYNAVGAHFFGRDEAQAQEYANNNGYTKINDKWKRVRSL